FHLMRVMEVGLRVTAKALGVEYAPSWESYLRQMHPLIEANWQDKPDRWRGEEVFFKDVYTYLHGVKRSWRNPTMHVKENYSPDVAKEIFDAVRGFMKHLATKLTEETPQRSESLIPAEISSSAAVPE